MSDQPITMTHDEFNASNQPLERIKQGLLVGAMYSRHISGVGKEIVSDAQEALSEVRAQLAEANAEIARLREALETFARVYQRYLTFCVQNDEPNADFENWITNYGTIYQSAYQKAHSVVYPNKQQPTE